MNHHEMKWNTNNGTEIFAQVWEPVTVKPRAVICHVHGLGEHSSRYAHVAEAFGREGFIFFTFDLPGHGRSGGSRGHIRDIEDFMQAIDKLFEQARSRYAGLPMFLYGHSLGGILVLHYGLLRKPQVRGVIATSSGLRTALEEQPAKIMAARLLGSLMPATTIASGLDAQALSRDPKVIQAYQSDPLVHDKVSLGFGKIMMGVTHWTLTHAGEFASPLLLIHGKEDSLAYPSGSTEFAAPLGNKCTLVLWDGGYHELHNEPEKEEVFKTMSLWMDARLHE